MLRNRAEWQRENDDELGLQPLTKKALINRADLTRMADIANEKNVTVEIECGDTIIRVMPFHPYQTHRHRLTREEEAEAALLKWKRSKTLPDDFAL